MRITILLILFFLFELAGIALPAAGNFYKDSMITEEKSPFIQELRIYPNPTKSGRVRLELNNGEISEILLIDITGKKLLAEKPEQVSSGCELSLSEVPDGIYFIRVKTRANKVIVKKLVVSNK
jgi:hypothetical protein